MNFRSMCLSSIAAGLVLVTSVSAGDFQPSSSSQLNSDKMTISHVQSSMPVAFTKNMGQWPDSILYRADGGGGTMWFTRDGIHYQFTRRIAKSEPSLMRGAVDSPEMLLGKFGHERDSIETIMIKAQFVESSADVEVVGLDELEYNCNYFIGNEPSNWHTDVPNFSGITYRNLYPGVDALFGATDGQMECRLTAASDAALAQVQVEYLGAEAVTKESGEIATLQTAFGEMRFAGALPVAGGDERGAVKAASESASGGLVVVYGTYLGAGNDSRGIGIAVDTGGSAYVTGRTTSANFQVLDPYQTYQGSSDIFVTRINAAGDGLVFSTFIGGDSIDVGNGVALDVDGNAYVTGETFSPDFPTVNPIQTLQGACDAFVIKLSPAGNSLVYGTCLGGSVYDVSIRDSEEGLGIDVDLNGNCYVTGSTNCVDFPLQNPLKAAKTGSYDVFVSKLAVDGGSLEYSTYFGGGGSEFGCAVAVSDTGNAYITGQTSSTDLPTQNPVQTTYGGGADAFVAELSSDGSSLVFSTYLGGPGWDVGNDIAVGSDGSAYVVGKTAAAGFPLVNPLQGAPGDESHYDMFLTKFSPNGSTLHFSTYIGGVGHDIAYGVALDNAENIYLTGYHDTGLWPKPSSPQQPQGYMNDVIIAAVSSGGDSLLCSGYLLPQFGADTWEEAYAIAADGAGNAYVTGMTAWGGRFPFPDPYFPFQGNSNAFVAKLVSPFSDRDADGLLDVNDNCPLLFNPQQEDSNTDGIGDACCCTAARGNVNGSSGETPDLSDLSFLISYLTQTPRPVLACPNEANVNAVGGIDLSDLTVLISYLTETPAPVIPNCP